MLFAKNYPANNFYVSRIQCKTDRLDTLQILPFFSILWSKKSCICKVKKTLFKILLVLNWVAVLSLIISYLSIYIPPDKQWLPSLFGIAYPIILTVNVVFIIFWLVIKPRNMLFSLIAIVAGWGFLSRYVQLSGEKIEKGEVKVLSYNVQHFRSDGTRGPEGKCR